MLWRRRPLVAGAVTLFLSGLAIRAVSTVYRVALVRVAGEDILGLYQLTLPIYRLGWTLATFGIPVAISQLSADRAGQPWTAPAWRAGFSSRRHRRRRLGGLALGSEGTPPH